MPDRKRIGILSRHAVPNYGSILQASALQWVLEDLGYEAMYLNYRIRRDAPLRAARSEAGFPTWLLRAIPKKISEHEFESLRRRVLAQTPPVYSRDELEKLSRAFDVLCVGGDQVWNVMSDGRVDRAYLLDFGTDGIPRFSYGSSFGSGRMAECDRPRFARALSRFGSVSVREASGAGALAEIGIGSTVVVDPVHLLTAEEWRGRIDFKAPHGLSRDGFVLVYNLHPDEKFRRYLQVSLAGSSIPVVSIRPTLRRSYGKSVFYPSLEEFLWMFMNARCVYTDSFHGTAFSILFNTPFIEYVPRENSDRNVSILREFGLLDRTTAAMSSTESWDMDDRWDDVNRRLEEARGLSLEFLGSFLNRSLDGAERGGAC